MGRILAVLAVAGMVFAGGCSGVKTRVKGGEISRTLDEGGITDNYVQVIGIGAADESMTNKTQRMATSRQAAIVAGQYELLSVVKGVNLEGGITVEKAMQTDSRLSTQIDAAIKGAEILKTEWTDDDGCVVTLRLDKKKLKKLTKLNFK